MPELPEVEALADHLRRHATGATIGRIDISALSVLKTFDPPITALHGQPVTGATRWGKYLGLQAGDLYLVTHLSRAGWLRWSDKLAAAPLKPGKGPIALRVHLGTPGDAPGFDLTEAGTQKRLAVWVVRDPAAVPQIASPGPDALSHCRRAGRHIGRDHCAPEERDHRPTGDLRNRQRLQRRDPACGQAVTLRQRKTLSEGQLTALYEAMQSVLTDAVERSVGQQAATLKGEKRSGLWCMPAPGCPARCVAMWCGRCHSPISRSSIARPARPVARC